MLTYQDEGMMNMENYINEINEINGYIREVVTIERFEVQAVGEYTICDQAYKRLSKTSKDIIHLLSRRASQEYVFWLCYDQNALVEKLVVRIEQADSDNNVALADDLRDDLFELYENTLTILEEKVKIEFENYLNN